MLVLNQSEVVELLPMQSCIDVMAAALATLARGDAVLPLRTVVVYPNGTGAFAVMPAYLGTPTTIGAKIVTVMPGNHGTEFDSHQGAVLLFDAQNGSLAAILDGTPVTAIRTAAVSAVATRELARKDATSLAIIGSGVQAHTHLEAMCAVRPIKSLRVYSRNKANCEALGSVARERFHLDASVSSSAESAVRDADIVCTTTSASQPVVFGDWFSPGSHINAVGSSQVSAREIDPVAVVRSRLYVDRRESALKESGEIRAPLEAGQIGPDHIVGEIGELMIGRAPGRGSDSEITLFKSLGLAVEDLAAASYVYGEAVRRGMGTQVALGGARNAAH